jgi:hypothetical protein
MAILGSDIYWVLQCWKEYPLLNRMAKNDYVQYQSDANQYRYVAMI